MQIPQTAAKMYIARFSSGPFSTCEARVVLIMNTTRQSSALRKGFKATPIFPPILLPGIPATNTQKKTLPISLACISSTDVIYVVAIVDKAAVADSDRETDSKKNRNEYQFVHIC